MSRFFKSAAFPILIVVVLAFFAQKLISPGDREKVPNYSEFLTQVEQGRVESVTMNTKDNTIDVEPKGDEKKFETAYPLHNTEQSLVALLRDENKPGGAIDLQVKGQGRRRLADRPHVRAAVRDLPVLLALHHQPDAGRRVEGHVVRQVARQAHVGGLAEDHVPRRRRRGRGGRGTARDQGVPREPEEVPGTGARIPKGVLLYGPPGTGKTLLARAVAGEAGVPFFSISGSDFVEMFVGVGASRVRDLFEQAKQNSPCIIFMDEIDAVGRHRGAGLGGGHDEREQTLNQLLVEMDGFEMKDNIILIAATNRPDILDPALLRPGRFDRQIVVDRPDRKGRGRRSSRSTRAASRWRRRSTSTTSPLKTPGFTGADLSNLVNEAALLAARTGNREIDHNHLEEGIMRVIAGPEKKTRVMSEKERRVTAFHEMGHAIVAHYLENTDPVHKISVISRGQALGYTISLPTEDKFLTTRAELNDTMAMTLGGRAAEEIVFGEVTTGASNDLEKVTASAKQMVMRFGMSEKLGPRVFGHDHGQPFLGPRVLVGARLLGRCRTRDRRRDPADRRGGTPGCARHPRRAPGGARRHIGDPAAARDDRARAVPAAPGRASPRKRCSARTSPCRPQIPPPPPQPAPERPERAPRPLPRPGFAGGTSEMRSDDR